MLGLKRIANSSKTSILYNQVMKPISMVPIQRKYPGKWVVFEEKDLKTVIAASMDAKKAYGKARKAGVKVPILMKIPQESLPYVGSFTVK